MVRLFPIPQSLTPGIGTSIASLSLSLSPVSSVQPHQNHQRVPAPFHFIAPRNWLASSPNQKPAPEDNKKVCAGGQPLDGGEVAPYKIQRCLRPDGPRSDVGLAVEAKLPSPVKRAARNENTTFACCAASFGRVSTKAFGRSAGRSSRQ